MSDPRQRTWQYIRLMRLDRPIGWLLLMWPTLWALWIAGGGRPEPRIVVIFVAGVIVMRAAGCIVNDYADRDFDPHVERTRDRPLASRAVSAREAWGLFAALGFVALALVLQLNRLTILLSLAALFIAVTYPFMKRVTHFPQVHLGVAFSWGIPMAFSALTGEVPAAAWLLLAANLFWTVAYDTMYAMSDRPDDLRVGIKSTAVLFGRHDLFWVGVCYAASFVILLYTGSRVGLGGYFRLSIGVAAPIAALLLFQCRERDRGACFRAFVSNSWIGGVVFAGIVLDYLS
ncbi:MAG: 4-hydroxybenzoate octaprenyltransferase [Proteobacteria bacterium]|nr:MAG: 4-hydroxybenzoate octaprenyltransferase [Pseudomonadota bacterium]